MNLPNVRLRNLQKSTILQRLCLLCAIPILKQWNVFMPSLSEKTPAQTVKNAIIQFAATVMNT